MIAAIGTLSARQLVTLLGEWQSDAAAYEALADRIRLLAIDGRLLPGTRLPSERELAERLGRSRTTVVSAYRALREAGYLESRQGSGSVLRLPAAGVDAGEASRDESLINFSMATPQALPDLMDHVERAGSALRSNLGLTGVDFVGLPVLRAAIAKRYTDRGLPTSPEQIVVTAGAQHAIGIIGKALLGRGDRVLTDAPTYPHAYAALQAAGGRMTGVAMAPTGWDDEQLIDAFERVRPVLAYLMPDFHNPTGASMPDALRRRVVETAARTGTIVIDDQTTGELVIDRPWASLPLAAQARTAEERAAVITLGSTGKTVWSGLRIGWIRAEERHLSRIVAARAAVDLGVPVLEQLIVAEAIADMDAILAFRARELGTARDLLLGLLADQLPEWSVPKPDGGMVLWANLGMPASSALVLAARARGLQISGGPLFGGEGAFERFIRVPFTLPPAQLREGVSVLADAWRAVSRMASVGASALTQVA
ncbi:PLP-dependent aminotransferase family protein [Gryllotalpicola sp.]|uniref:MocR-like transcription factor YczR n=1 Tax=Gryllotalpicola sp. TaxID=1932787 RepID=UPI00263791CB|nr:PLP-dependent aminotransferase family protein [Gryllotalpicola sp.]